MSSNRQSKSKTVKTRQPTTRRKDQRTLADLGSTLSNSRSVNKFNHSHNSRKQIPKILSKIEKNVQDLKQYCSDITPNVSKKKHDARHIVGQNIRTIDDRPQNSISSVDEIKKNYMSYYGKDTENIHQLWKFYNSFLSKSQIKRTSLTSQSVSMPNKSQNLPDFSLESKDISGRNSALGLIERMAVESTSSVNFSDLFSNRPSDRERKSKNQTLEKVVQQQEWRPVQPSKPKSKPVKNIQFNLNAQLDIVSHSYIQNNQQNISKSENRTADVSSRQPKKSPSKPIVEKTIVEKINIKQSPEFALFQHVVETKVPKVQVVIPLREIKLESQSTNIPKEPNVSDVQETTEENKEKDFFKKIFEKNMLINKRKQQLNSKLKNGTKASEAQYENPYHEQGLDEAVIIEDKPLQEYQLPLSKQDISLLEKLDQLDKQIIPIPKSEGENCVFQALKKLKKKKDFQQSKFGVAQIPVKKFTKQPQIIDIPLQQYNVEPIKIQPLKKKDKQKETINSSLIDCEIEGIQAEDSLLQNLQDISIDL